MTLIEQIRDKIARNQYEFSEESGEIEVTAHVWKETMVEQKVTYTLLVDGKFFIVENVPARVCLETGERFFSPETVERLQQTLWEHKQPSRIVETPVYDFAV